MVEAGHVPDLGAAFDGYLHDGGPAWVVKHALDPLEGVSLIRAAGGVAVLAHPACTGLGYAELVGLIDGMVLAGLAGIEADHAGHTVEESAVWRRVAVERSLAVTGSSDFHGDRKQVQLGAATTPQHVVTALGERARLSPVGGRSRW
jgi:predicted metal-dependent phosphoesterase TrpH